MCDKYSVGPYLKGKTLVFSLLAAKFSGEAPVVIRPTIKQFSFNDESPILPQLPPCCMYIIMTTFCDRCCALVASFNPVWLWINLLQRLPSRLTSVVSQRSCDLSCDSSCVM